jgi:hypothetical protein
MQFRSRVNGNEQGRSARSRAMDVMAGRATRRPPIPPAYRRFGASAMDLPHAATPAFLRPFPRREPRLRAPLRRPRHAPGHGGRKPCDARAPAKCIARRIRGREDVSALVLLVHLAVLAARPLPSSHHRRRRSSWPPPLTEARPSRARASPHSIPIAQPLLSLPWTPSNLFPSSLPPDCGPEHRTTARSRVGCCAPPWTARRRSNRPAKATSRPSSVPSSSRSRPPAKSGRLRLGTWTPVRSPHPGDYIALIRFFSGFPM